MKNLLLNIVLAIIPKLIEKYLTPENIEKYSDKLFDLCRKGINEIEDDRIKELLNDIIDILDENIGNE